MDLGSVPGHLGADNALSDEASIQLYSHQMCKAESNTGQKISKPGLIFQFTIRQGKLVKQNRASHGQKIAETCLILSNGLLGLILFSGHC